MGLPGRPPPPPQPEGAGPPAMWHPWARLWWRSDRPRGHAGAERLPRWGVTDGGIQVRIPTLGLGSAGSCGKGDENRGGGGSRHPKWPKGSKISKKKWPKLLKLLKFGPHVLKAIVTDWLFCFENGSPPPPPPGQPPAAVCPKPGRHTGCLSAATDPPSLPHCPPLPPHRSPAARRSGAPGQGIPRNGAALSGGIHLEPAGPQGRTFAPAECILEVGGFGPQRGSGSPDLGHHSSNLSGWRPPPTATNWPTANQSCRGRQCVWFYLQLIYFPFPFRFLFSHTVSLIFVPPDSSTNLVPCTFLIHTDSLQCHLS